MLYKKNSEKSLSDELFKNPTSEYRGAPFWAWNCELDKDELLRQIEILKEMGFGGFHMHSRSGMSTKYLSDDFMNLIRACCDKAKEEDMHAYLYDEDRWPSGAAGGIVTKDRRYSQRNLLITVNPVEATTDYDDAYKNGLPYYITEYNVRLNENGELLNYTQTTDAADGGETKWYVYTLVTNASPWYNNQTYVNTLSKEAIDKFIEVTHETYKKAVGDMFGNVVPTIFTDEPQFSVKGTLDFAESKNGITLPWTMDFDDSFKEIYGYSITDRLPELFWELPNGEISVPRYCYHKHVTNLFAASYTDNCGQWCEKNGIGLTGHVVYEESLYSQTSAIGEAMRLYRDFAIPGIDILCDNHEYTTAKQAQSVAHQLGKEGVTSELYGVTDWDFDFRGHKSQGDWQAALGVTLRVPHLSWVSMKGDAKRDYPASINYQSTWYKEYSYVENHFARVNTAMTRGKAIVKVGVIHPIETYWLHYGPKENTADIRDILDEQFHNVCEWLLSGTIDFDYISESLLPDMVGDISDTLSVGEMNYSTILVAGCETLRNSTVEILAKFKNARGNVIFVGDAPKYMDAVPSEKPLDLYNICKHTQLFKTEILNALSDDRLVEIRESDGQTSRNMIYQLRQDNDCKWLFIANMRKEEDCDNTVIYRERKITVDGEYTPLIYDTLSGEIKPAEYETKSGKTIIYYTFCKYDSLLLKLCPQTEKSYRSQEKHREIISVEYIKEKVTYTRSEPNVLLLDIAEYRSDNDTFKPKEEVRKIQANVKKRHNLKNDGTQPWAIEPEIPEHTVTLRYRFESETELSDTLLAIEDANLSTIYFNGEPVENKPVGYFTDISIETIKLPKIVNGENILEITLPLTNRSTIENAFILGNFNVRCEGITKTIIPMTEKIGFGDIVPQGMPFYGADIEYNMEINAPENCDAVIAVRSYKGAVMRASLDGEDLGIIAYQPYEVKVRNLKKGTHKLTVKLYGNRNNSFGALHLNNTKEKWIGPNAWDFMSAPPNANAYDCSKYWKYEYNLKPIGILAGPEITYLKK